MDFKEFSAKSIDDAITEACKAFSVTSDKLEWEVVSEGSSGFLGIGSKDAVIKAKIKSSLIDNAKAFLSEVFAAMNMTVVINVEYDVENREMNVDLSGDDMGALIGKRGQTLDSLQYLTSLVVNKHHDGYIRVKLDTENYRERRQQKLEELAHNIAHKVSRTKKSVDLEPMNPYERRIIHSALQDDPYVTTVSEGEEPYRHVVVKLKRTGRHHR